MMQNKKFKLLWLVLLLFILVGCTESEKTDKTEKLTDTTNNTDATEEDSQKTIVLVMKTLSNPFFIKMEEGARTAEEELGINLIVKTGANETSIDEQIAIVEDMIEQKVDAIVIAPGSSTELIPVLKKAQDSGIVIVNIDNRLDPKLSEEAGLVNVPFISVDNEEGAYLCGKYISDNITTPTEVAIIEGIRGADNAEQRKNGALRAFSENPNISVVAMETANWKIDEALTVVTSIYEKNPNIKAIFCANDMMALGVVEYMTKNNKEDIALGGFDALEEALSAIQAGNMSVTIDQQADVQGYTGIIYANDLLQGKEVPLETMIDVKVVDKSTLK